MKTIKLLTNQKGLSLIEILVVLLVMSIVFTVGTLLFSSVQSVFSNSNEQRSLSSDQSFTSQMLTRALSKPIQMTKVSNSEVQFHTWNDSLEVEFKALTFDPSTNTLMLHEASSESNLEVPNYTRSILLSEDISNFQMLNKDGTAIADGSGPDEKFFQIQLEFFKSRSTANGGSVQETSPPIFLTIKMMPTS